MAEEFRFKNIKKSQRNREIEGVIGAPLGLPDGVKLQVLAMSDANPRWVQHGDEYSAGLNELTLAGASPKQMKAFFDEWHPRLFVIGWSNNPGPDDKDVPFSLAACQSYFRQSDDAYLAIIGMVRETKNFRGARVEAVRRSVGNGSDGISSERPTSENGS